MRISDGIKKYREQFSYLVFGVLTTLVNYIVYFTLVYLGAHYVQANGTAIGVAILFAYFANKYFVFHSRARDWRGAWMEFFRFLCTRLFSAAVDMGSMVVLISFLHMGDIFVKIFTGVVVVVLNYITNKYFAFQKGR